MTMSEMENRMVLEVDSGTAYGMTPPTYREELVEVGPGTPMGELMRRYWQPVFRTDLLTDERPHRVRVLGEDLIVFRAKNGRPGLVRERCCHRGTSLHYGRIEEDGIRCCYHGWKFDVEGRCLDQPAEIEGGRNRARIRQPWYPVEERYGLVYAYMGPPEKKPVLPRWAVFENLGPDEYVELRTGPPYGPVTESYTIPPVDFNWLQAYENSTDAPHVPWLHYHHSGDQFTDVKFADAELPPYARIKDLVGGMHVERSKLGVLTATEQTGPHGETLCMAGEAILPNMAHIPHFIDLMYIVPADDRSYTNFMLFRSKIGTSRGGAEEQHNGKTWWDMSEEEHRIRPGDYEAQRSIGQVPAHSQENLSQGDLGLVLLRRRLAEAARSVAEGQDPPGLIFDPAAPPLCSEGFEMMPKEFVRFGQATPEIA